MCFGCSKEPSHGDGSFEYPQHTFWLRNKKKINYALISRGLMPYLTIKGTSQSLLSVAKWEPYLYYR